MRETLRTDPDSSAAAARPVVVASRARCPHCLHRNPSDRQFCAGCGARLYDSCIACGATAAIQEKYCGSCGIELVKALLERTATLEKQIELGQMLRREGNLQEAMKVLASVTTATDHRLKAFQGRATQLVAEIDAERQQWLAQREQSFTQASALFDQLRVDEAAAALEPLPDWVRNDAIREQLGRIRQLQAEIALLTTEIRTATQSKQWTGLLPKVERLLELQPTNARAARLAESLRAHEQKQLEKQRRELCGAAKAELDQRNYAAVAKILAEIPEAARTPQIARLLEESQAKADEIEWMRDDLYHAAEYDEHLLPIAKRLFKLAPDDTNVRKIASQLAQYEKERSESQGRAPRGTMLPWMKKAAQKQGRPQPVDCLGRIAKIGIAEGDPARAVAAEPDAFCVAIGLALQGIGKGPVEINLLPQQGRGVLNLMRQAIQKHTAKSAWGIDVGRRAIKVVKVGFDSAGLPVVETADIIEHDAFLNQPEANAAEILGRTLETLVSRHEIQREPVCLGIPSGMVLARYLSLPVIDDKKLDKAMRYEAQQQLPVSLEETTWDYQVLSKQAESGDLGQQYELALFAMRTDTAKQYLAPWLERNLNVDILQSDAMALHNFLAVDHFGHGAPTDADAPKRTPPTIAYLDSGTESGNLLITNGSSLWTRTLSVGGNQFTRAIIKELEVSFAKAEQLKWQPLTFLRLSRLYQAMEPVFQELLNELQRSLDYYGGLTDRRMYQKLVVLGGNMRLHGMLRRLRA